MTLRSKLLLAQAPMAIAVAIVGVLASVTNGKLGRNSELILKDNYRSVLAAQRMKEAIERIDSAALFIVAGEQQAGVRQSEEYIPRFERELETQEGNVTETGEQPATHALRARWDKYLGRLRLFVQAHDQACAPAPLLRAAAAVVRRGQGRRRHDPGDQSGRDGAQERAGAQDGAAPRRGDDRRRGRRLRAGAAVVGRADDAHPAAAGRAAPGGAPPGRGRSQGARARARPRRDRRGRHRVQHHGRPAGAVPRELARRAAGGGAAGAGGDRQPAGSGAGLRPRRATSSP